ncbi:uncharacterized protein LOC142601648 isoform X2 [Balearica regulorum gibbericeps]|uniref:uncharacterized protein LOC142601648 isoform X2 n=1 Tax=Balearica regulorum gibbericeps TaxID=100784 RepID=UPI003F636C81
MLVALPWDVGKLESWPESSQEEQGFENLTPVPKVTCGTTQITDLNKMSLMIKSGVFRTVFLKKCSGVVANETRTDRQSAEREISDGLILCAKERDSFGYATEQGTFPNYMQAKSREEEDDSRKHSPAEKQYLGVLRKLPNSFSTEPNQQRSHTWLSRLG